MTAKELLDAKKMYDDLALHFRGLLHEEFMKLLQEKEREPRCRAMYKNDKEDRIYGKGYDDGYVDMRNVTMKVIERILAGPR